MVGTHALRGPVALVVCACAIIARGEDSPPSAQPPTPLTLDLGPKVKLNLVQIAAGKFVMGCPKNEEYRLSGDFDEHEVTITKPFYLGAYPVTQEQYAAIMRASPSKFKGATHPVEQVSWTEAQAFCKKASAKTHRKFRLPTEAEWEYACRAGTQTAFSFGGDWRQLGDHAWYGDNSGKTTHPVGEKKPNAFGLYDMHGNVWQWCSDWHSESYDATAVKDPRGPKSGKNHVARGGAWLGDVRMCRSAFRTSSGPDTRLAYFGFRVVVESAVQGGLRPEATGLR
jgi:formylglycine-generating enzyme required for sulfatase activity